MSSIINADTSDGLKITSDTSGLIEFQSAGVTKAGVNATGLTGDGSQLTGLPDINSGTAVASTSGTSIDFTGIPSGTKRITVLFQGVSLNGSSNIQIQLGDSGGIETTGYVGGAWTNNVTVTSTTGALISGGYISAWAYSGTSTIFNFDSNTWVFSSCGAASNNGNPTLGGSSKSTSATLDRIRITTLNGTDAFDAGSINILYEQEQS